MKKKSKRSLALLLAAALLAGIFPAGSGTKSRAAEQPALRNPRILKTTQEMEPGSSEKKELKNPATEDGVTTWDCIWFGNYWQEDTNGDGKADKNDEKTPIKWRVLSVDGDDAFLVADKNLDVQRYNDTSRDVTWETCTMRSWLNGYGAEKNTEGKDYSGDSFFQNAFSADEQSAIRTVNAVNDDNPEYETEGGNDTEDKVYLLSSGEVTNPAYGFTSSTGGSNTRQSVNTAYTAAGGEINSSRMSSAGRTNDWWLRSPGIFSEYASFVSSFGSVNAGGGIVDDYNVAVRPALHLNLKASPDALSPSGWSYAGTVPSDDVAEWDSIWFGNYWQEDTNGDGKVDKSDAKTPIKWRVLSVDGDDAFLVADKNLDCRKYNDTSTDVTWETCTVRSWLNGYGAEKNAEGTDYSDSSFLASAFSPGEQSAIRAADVVNEDNPWYGTEGGSDTEDRVYLLSFSEATNPEYGFGSFPDCLVKGRRALNTAFAEEQGAWTSTSEEYAGNGYWWLRSLGGNSGGASYVRNHGYVDASGYAVDGGIVGVRPALHLNLKASPDASSPSVWSYAGTVTSDGKGNEEAPPAPGESTEPTGTPEPAETPGASSGPDVTPTATPTAVPSVKPTETPGNTPTAVPSAKPTEKPGNTPTAVPTAKPTETPGNTPTAVPSVKPTEKPGNTPTAVPTAKPTEKPGEEPTAAPHPTVTPTVGPSVKPTEKPGEEPTAAPVPTVTPTVGPSAKPTETPGNTPTAVPSVKPTEKPGEEPTAAPHPTVTPSAVPSAKPTETPGNTPTAVPSVKPTEKPGEEPTAAPHPTVTPSAGPSAKPTETPGNTPTAVPSVKPTEKPGEEPTAAPHPTVTPAPGTGVPSPSASAVSGPSATQDVSVTGKVPKVFSVKLKQKKQAVTVSWKKVSGASGYQVCYSTSKKWKKKKQKLTRKVKLTIKKLKKKKTYYFRVRAYRMNGTKKVYGAWSKGKKVKIKK